MIIKETSVFTRRVQRDYWSLDEHTILMLFAFAKNERSDLSREQLRQLATLVQEEFS